MKRLIAFVLTLTLLLAGVSAHADLSDILVSNPLPDIYERVSPAVCALVSVTWKWNADIDYTYKVEEGFGSAVLVDARGYFITNYHVVDQSDELEIWLADGSVHEAYVVGYDAACDVAVVKVDDKIDVEPVKIGSSSALRVGELVCAIGTPLDQRVLFNTLTAGVVSGLNRNDADDESQRAVDLIQIDASINPGNSGGALLNTKGELVGIPYMKYVYSYYKTETEEEFITYESLAFALPMDTLWPIAQSIIETGAYKRPRFGVSVLDIEGPEEPLKNYPPAGLRVEEVESGGSGARAGLRAGDVITHVNGERVYNFRDYTKIIDKLADNEPFEITVVRYKDAHGDPLQKFMTLKLTVVLEMID